MERLGAITPPATFCTYRVQEGALVRVLDTRVRAPANFLRHYCTPYLNSTPAAFRVRCPCRGVISSSEMSSALLTDTTHARLSVSEHAHMALSTRISRYPTCIMHPHPRTTIMTRPGPCPSATSHDVGATLSTTCCSVPPCRYACMARAQSCRIASLPLSPGPWLSGSRILHVTSLDEENSHPQPAHGSDELGFSIHHRFCQGHPGDNGLQLDGVRYYVR